jgi:acyl-coenzyme A thioesterase 9
MFGGYLMREAHELAWMSAARFSRDVPYTVSVDNVSFHKPVEIGAILRLTSEVVHCLGHPDQTLQVSVRFASVSE